MAGTTGVRAAGAQRRSGRAPLVGVSFGLNTRRAAVLAVVVCALALTLAVPLRTYVAQRQELAATARSQALLNAEVTRLQSQLGRLQDPAYVESQARERLRYVKPGETPYRVQLPADVARATAQQQRGPAPPPPWYSTLWGSVAGSGR